MAELIFIHGGVGSGQQRRRIMAVLGVERRAYADRGVVRLAAWKFDWPRDAGADPLGERPWEGCGVDRVDDHDEFVAADASREIAWAQCRADLPCDCDETGVPRRMPRPEERGVGQE